MSLTWFYSLSQKKMFYWRGSLKTFTNLSREGSLLRVVFDRQHDFHVNGLNSVKEESEIIIATSPESETDKIPHCVQSCYRHKSYYHLASFYYFPDIFGTLPHAFATAFLFIFHHEIEAKYAGHMLIVFELYDCYKWSDSMLLFNKYFNSYVCSLYINKFVWLTLSLSLLKLHLD